MIKVTRINHTEFYVNADMVLYVEATPDTIITLNNERKLVVTESPEEVVKRIIEYKQQTYKLIAVNK